MPTRFLQSIIDCNEQIPMEEPNQKGFTMTEENNPDAQEHEEVADDEMEDVAGGGVGGHDHEPHGKKKGKAAPGKRHNSTRSNRGA